MKSQPQGARRPFRLPAEKIHLSVVREFVVQHCQGFSWSQKVLGALRARDFPTLLKVAGEVKEAYLSSAVYPSDEEPDTEYGSAAAFLAASQFVALVAKYQYRPGLIPGLDPDRAAKEDFLRSERRNRRLNIVFGTHLARRTERHWCIPLIRDEICRVLGRTPHYEEILRNSDFSAGASVMHHGSNTHLAKKLGADKFSGGGPAFSYFVAALWENSQYVRTFFPGHGVNWTVSHTAFENRIRSMYEEVDYNIVTVVPKTSAIGRTIAMEPEACNFLQKGVDLTMRQLLKRKMKIDLAHQEPNQLLAFQGSVTDLDPYVTIDVRGASNSVITQLVRSVVPPKWFRLLDRLRSPCFSLDGVVQPYEMFCSMGNGFCFPLETLIFAAICKAAARHVGHKPDFRCYGDDIVVRQSLALVVLECLRACGFRVNTSKTFIFGPFRESCGANWYGGQDVTPGNFETPVTTVAELHALHNSMHKWPKIQALLRSFAPKDRCYMISREAANDPNGGPIPWVTNQAFIVPLDVAMSCRGTIWSSRYQTWDFRILVTMPQPDEDWVGILREGAKPHADHFRLTAALRGSTDATQPFHHRRRTFSVRTMLLGTSEKLLCIDELARRASQPSWFCKEPRAEVPV